jgi:hypothetical protein
MSDARYLVLMDTDRIKDYIFTTNRLKEIRGASLLLDRLNTQECCNLLAGFGGEEVFIGGGGVLATFRKKSQASSYMAAVRAASRRETHIATITGIVVPIPVAPAGERAPLRQARTALHLAKGARTQTQALLTNPYFRLCQSCNRYPVTAVADGDELCAACFSKRQAAQLQPEETASNPEPAATFPSYSGYTKFANRALALFDDDRWQRLTKVPPKLDQLEGPETNHIGFIHADINNLGTFLEQQDSLTKIKEVSQEVAKALESALIEAVHKVRLVPRGQTWPFLIIVMGGDDMLLVVAAKRAVPLANELCLAFERHIKAALGNATDAQEVGKLALSAGVVISKPGHPAYALADRAEELVKSAKRRSHELYAEHGPIPTLDMQVIHTPTANPVETVRKNEYFRSRNGQQYWYTFRPLSCSRVGPWPGVTTLLHAIHRLRRSDFPRNKLNEWADLLNADEIEQILRWQLLQTRISNEAHRAMQQTIEVFSLSREWVFAQPGGVGAPYFTPLLDIVELYDFAGLFAIIEAGPKFFHNRIIGAFAGCVHFADHPPSVG